MKAIILLVPLLAVVAAKTTCDCDFTSRAVICKGLSLTEFHKKDSGCENAFWRIDISKNNLEVFPSDLQQFRKVNLSQNSLELLEASVDQKVQYLDVSRNNILKIDLGNKFLSLRHLVAANNYLGVSKDFLDGQCNVVHLDVSGNKITTLDAVTRCTHLSILEAYDNKIFRVPKELVLLTKLQVLDLSTNDIKVVSGLPPTLGILDLTRNNIQRVSDSSFRGLALLQALDLSANIEIVIEEGAFATVSSLQSLRLRGINLKFLSRELFTGLNSLRSIDFTFNSIQFLSNDTFRDLPSLEKVILEFNRLRTLPALEFGRRVNHITFGINSITKMDHSALLTMFSGTRDGRDIYLYINNFRGDDPEWSNVLKYFDWECNPSIYEVESYINNPLVDVYGEYSLTPSPCACATFTNGNWRFGACIVDGAVVDGLPWLEAAEIYAGIKANNSRQSKLKKDEF